MDDQALNSVDAWVFWKEILLNVLYDHKFWLRVQSSNRKKILNAMKIFKMANLTAMEKLSYESAISCGLSSE
jgi:hypothetical protein